MCALHHQWPAPFDRATGATPLSCRKAGYREIQDQPDQKFDFCTTNDIIGGKIPARR